MDGPLAPVPITPGLRPHRVARANGDRKRKDRSFQDEMAHERDHPDEPQPAPASAEAAGQGHEFHRKTPGHRLDVEA